MSAVSEHVAGLPVDPIERLRLRRSAKWQTYPPDVLPLTVAEMDFELAQPIRDVLCDAIQRSDSGYAMAVPDLGNAVAGFAAQRWGWDLDPAAVTAVTDVGVGVVEMLRVLTRPGDDVVISPPVYPPFFGWAAESGRQLTEVALTHDGAGWRLDLDALEAAFARHPGAYILCNPHNPVGRVHSADELAALVRLATIYHVPIISDEIHGPLVLPGATFTPLLTVPGACDVAVAIVSASKAFNLAGLKCGTVVTGSAAMQARVEQLPPDVRWRIGHLGVLATVTALTTCEPWLDDLLATLDDRRTALSGLIRDRLPSVAWDPPEATYLAWLDCRSVGPDTEPRDRFLERGRVALEPGLRFGAAGSGYVRLNFATSVEVLDRATGAMHESLSPPLRQG